MSGAYESRQIVGMDLHRRRSVLVRMTATGQLLETVRISNDPEYLREVDEMPHPPITETSRPARALAGREKYGCRPQPDAGSK